jgi:hypothetical protein
MAFEILQRLCEEVLALIRAVSEIPSLTQRVEALEARKEPGTSSPPESLSPYTASPATWPAREAKSDADFPISKEYKSDAVDLEIAKAIIRLAPESWGTLRLEIARRRRLTIQQVAELKARITRLKLLRA